MLPGAELVAFVGSCDLERSDGFYRGVLGCEPRDVNDGDLRPAGNTVLGWRVPEIAAAVQELSRSGVSFLRYSGLEQDEIGVWTAPGGTRVAWFPDPDGNVLSLAQPANA